MIGENVIGGNLQDRVDQVAILLLAPKGLHERLKTLGVAGFTTDVDAGMKIVRIVGISQEAIDILFRMLVDKASESWMWFRDFYPRAAFDYFLERSKDEEALERYIALLVRYNCLKEARKIAREKRGRDLTGDEAKIFFRHYLSSFSVHERSDAREKDIFEILETAFSSEDLAGFRGEIARVYDEHAPSRRAWKLFSEIY